MVMKIKHLILLLFRTVNIVYFEPAQKITLAAGPHVVQCGPAKTFAAGFTPESNRGTHSSPRSGGKRERGRGQQGLNTITTVSVPWPNHHQYSAYTSVVCIILKLDAVTLYLSHYVTEIYRLVQFNRLLKTLWFV